MIRQHRLTGSRDFKAVFSRGKTFVHRLLIAKVLRTHEGEPSRFGFSTSKKLGKAVIRNRAKRLLRESVRLLLDRMQDTGYDAVLIARPPIREAHVDDVKQAVEELFSKASLFR